jgi:DNA-binding transcriptional ArsR family regulator
VDGIQIALEPRRREILRLVWDRELASGEIASHFDLTFGAVSQHLAVLRKAGFVNVRRAGNHRYYQADRKQLGSLAVALEAMWIATLDQLADAVDSDSDRS